MLNLKSKQKIFCFFLLISLLFGQQVFALMESTNYKIIIDSLNVGGLDSSTSTNYILLDTIGETAVGTSSSATYQIGAGYRQMLVTYLSVTIPGNVTLSPEMTGSNNESFGTNAWTVITDNYGGYTLSLSASSSPAFCRAVGVCFTDYTQAAPSAWSTGASDYKFGFSASGDDVTVATWGSGNCSSGTNLKFRGLNSNTLIETVRRTSANHPTGVATTICYRAERGVQANPTTGTYSATLSATVVAL